MAARRRRGRRVLAHDPGRRPAERDHRCHRDRGGALRLQHAADQPGRAGRPDQPGHTQPALHRRLQHALSHPRDVEQRRPEDPFANAAGFTNTLDYNLQLQLSTDAGALSATCDAGALAGGGGGCAYYGNCAGQGLSSGEGVALKAPATLKFDWTTAPKRLVAGTYTDTVTIVVEARS
jgi:hypothetical protein